MNDFEKRINLKVPLEELSKKVCKLYDLGELQENYIIEIGYEDFNYVLTTSTGKFVVKVFSSFRTDEDAKQLTNRALVAYENGVSSPKILKVNDNGLNVVNIGGINYRLFVMEHIDGYNFYTLKQLPNDRELEVIAKELAKLNNIKFDPPFIYDKWAIMNFNEEYNKNISLIDNEDKELVNKAYKLFNECDFSKLEYGFVHGDIIETNVIKDKNGKLYFIDFSVSNYLPRIVDLAVTICDLCLDMDNIDDSKKRTKIFINAYESVSKLSDYEKECLKKFIVCHQAITILETCREKKVENNKTEENEIFLNKGKTGIRFVTKENFIN